jgi:preprotein translocase subunit SecY
VLETLKNMFKVPEIRKRFIFTFFIIVVFRLGAQIPTPGIDPVLLKGFSVRPTTCSVCLICLQVAHSRERRFFRLE